MITEMTPKFEDVELQEITEDWNVNIQVMQLQRELRFIQAQIQSLAGTIIALALSVLILIYSRI